MIGVEDDGGIFELDQDFNLVDNSKDGFQRLLVSLVAEYMGESTAPTIRIRFELVKGKGICVVDVDRSPEPVFMRFRNGDTKFFVRAGSTSRPLNHKETLEYVKMHW